MTGTKQESMLGHEGNKEHKSLLIKANYQGNEVILHGNDLC